MINVDSNKINVWSERIAFEFQNWPFDSVALRGRDIGHEISDINPLLLFSCNTLKKAGSGQGTRLHC